MADLLRTSPARRIPLDAVFNFRDLGGYEVPGGYIAWGRLYRADGLHRGAEAVVEAVRNLGVRTVIDLRTHDERTVHGFFPCESVGARYHHLPIIEAIWDPGTFPEQDDAASFLAERYIDMLLQGGHAMAEALAVLADVQSYPVVFHCAAGKDRTGVLAAVVLALLGVDEDTIAEDYSLSAEAMKDMVAWAEVNVPGAAEAMASQPKAMLEAPAAAMLGLLEWVRREYGSMASYVAQLGVDDSTIEALNGTLVIHI